ncbi:hypothetical protein Tco_0912040 [Tanacetum coccineum]
MLQTSKRVEKCVKKFNPYARYNVEHWKNPHAKIFHIKKQKEPGKPKEVVYSNSKIVQIIKTYWKLGHEHKFITKIVARRENGSIVSITESYYKNLNKNDIEDIYLLIVNHKVDDYVETGLLWSLSVFIRSTVIWERVHDFQLGLKSYNNDVKHGYVTQSLSNEDVEYMQLFEEEIEEQLKHRDKMRPKSRPNKISLKNGTVGQISRLMRLAKKVGGTVEVSESLRGKLVKTMWEEVSCCRTSCIYSGEEDQSFSIQSSLKSKMACAKWGMSRCFATSSSYRHVNHESKGLDRVLVAEFIDGEQFVTEEIIEEENRKPNIKVRTTWDRKIIGLHLRMEERSPYTKIEEVRIKASQCEEGCFKAIEGNAKEY